MALTTQSFDEGAVRAHAYAHTLGPKKGGKKGGPGPAARGPKQINRARRILIIPRPPLLAPRSHSFFVFHRIARCRRDKADGNHE